jgi:hypothetical protein
VSKRNDVNRARVSGAQHSDGSRIALSHSYPHVCVIFADIVGIEMIEME